MIGEEIMKELSAYSPEQLDVFQSRVEEQRYSSSMASQFVNSRLLNYWIEENKLLDKWEGKGWRKFSFVELVWLKIINDLRSFGVSFEILRKLKQELFFVPDTQKIIRIIKESKSRINELSAKVRSDGDKKLLNLLTSIDAIESEIQPAQVPNLQMYILLVALLKSAGSLLVNVEGDHMFVLERFWELNLMKEVNRKFVRGSHVSISLTDIVEYFILKEEVDVELRKDVFSADEWKIIDILRKEKPDSLVVKFDAKHKIDLIEIEKVRRADLSQHLSDIILKDGYETITLTTQKGKIVVCRSRKKIK